MPQDNYDLNCTRPSRTVGANPSAAARVTRASSRIRKQRFIARQEHSEDDNVDDPFADNSDVDSNYSAYFGRKRKRNKYNIENNKDHPAGECLGDKEQLLYRMTRTGCSSTATASKRRARKCSSASHGTQLNNQADSVGARSASVCCSTHSNGDERHSTSIPSLNKNGRMRGRHDTSVSAANHWFSSLDRHFKVGKFLMDKRDKPLLNTCELRLWRIDSKSMLQKYEAFRDADTTGKINFRPVKVYSGWSPLNTDGYALVPVTACGIGCTSGQQHVIQIDLTKHIDIDSDE